MACASLPPSARLAGSPGSSHMPFLFLPQRCPPVTRLAVPILLHFSRRRKGLHSRGEVPPCAGEEVPRAKLHLTDAQDPI